MLTFTDIHIVVFYQHCTFALILHLHFKYFCNKMQVSCSRTWPRNWQIQSIWERSILPRSIWLLCPSSFTAPNSIWTLQIRSLWTSTATTSSTPWPAISWLWETFTWLLPQIFTTSRSILWILRETQVRQITRELCAVFGDGSWKYVLVYWDNFCCKSRLIGTLISDNEVGRPCPARGDSHPAVEIHTWRLLELGE